METTKTKTWRQWIHRSHHPYVERQLGRWMAAGHQVTFEPTACAWSYKGEIFHTLNAVAQRIHDEQPRRTDHA